MRKRVMGFLLAVSMFLALTPNTVMAARMEGNSLHIHETAQQTEPAPESEAVPEAAGDASAMEGAGTETMPYRIQNAGQLCAFTDMVNGVNGVPDTSLCAVLMCDIDLSGVCGPETGSWTPIGTSENPYAGTFDGSSFVITGLFCNKSGASYAGLFGHNVGTIKNLGIVGADITAGSYTGGVCGYNNGIITGCYHAASVKGVNYTGGICGYNDGGGTVSVCYNTGTVSGSKYVGGICGYNKNKVADCYNMGPVAGDRTSIGGICGYNKASVSNCFNTGSVVGGGKNYIGSVCGYNHSKSIFLNCYYLITGEEKGNYGAAMSKEQFASGEVCWLLNGGKSENVVWFQTCGVGFPAFGGKTVYQLQRQKAGGRADEIIVAYTNEREQKQAADVSAQENPSDQDSGDAEHKHNYRDPEWKWTEYESAKAVFTCQDCGEKLTLQAKISDKTTAPTCAAEGKTVYTASVNRDGRTYQDKKTVKSEKLPHQPLQHVEQKIETCEEEGMKDCWTCPACGTYFTNQQGTTEIPKNQVVVPATGHHYVKNGDWVWDTDTNPVRASLHFICINPGCGNEEIEEADDITTTTTATCTEEGNTVYTATLRFDNETYTGKKEVPGKKLPHSYGEPEWEWASGKQTATATFTCKVCKNSAVPITVNTTSERTEPTCLEEGKIVYTASVTFEKKEYTDDKTDPIPKTGHSYSGKPKWTWEKDYSKATAALACDICKQDKVKVAVIEETETSGDCKTPGTITYTASAVFSDKTYTDIKTKEIAPAHTLTIHVAAKEATCTSEGNKEYWQCGVCGKLFGDEEGTEEITTGIPTIPELEHDFKKVAKDVYWCRLCNKSFTITEQPDGTQTISSVEDDAVVWQAAPEQTDLEETQEENADQPVGEQTKEGGQDSGDEDSAQDGQNGIMEAPENAARYGLIYPESEGEENNLMPSDAWEENAVNLRTKSQGNAAEQTDQERQASSLWGSAALLLMLAVFILILFYRGRKLCKLK